MSLKPTRLEQIRSLAHRLHVDNPDGESPEMLKTHAAAVRAVDALKTYPNNGTEPVPDTIVDLLVDLQHLCKGMDVNFGDLVDRAVTHFEAEDVDE